MGAGKF